MQRETERVLIYRLGSMGDTVVSLPAFHLIERAFPKADRRLLTNVPINEKAAAAAAILENSGLIQGYFHYPVATRSVKILLRLWWQLVRWRPQVMVYLGSARGVESAKRDAMFFRMCGIKRQIGVPVTEDMQRNRWRPDPGCEELECERLVRNIAELGELKVDSPEAWDLRLTVAERAKADEVLVPAAGRPILAVSLGTKVMANNWGRDKWKALLARMGAAYPEYVLAFTGVAGDSEVSEYVADGWREAAGTGNMVINLCGKLTPRESAACFAKARAFVGHDSGPMHLADAVGTQCIAIFSARNPPRRWFPHGANHRMVYHKVHCHGCGMRECMVERMKCVTSITVDEVFAEVCAALEGQEPMARPPWLDVYEVSAEHLMEAGPMLPELHQVLNLLEGGFTELKLLVVGDIMLDRYIHGEVERISPEAPVPVLRHAQRYDRAGGAANVALNLAGLGCQTFLAGFWGNDTEKSDLAAILEQGKINTVGVVSSSLPTISKTRIIGRMQQMLRLDIESRDLPPAVEMERLIERAVGLTQKVHAVVISDYAKGVASVSLCEAVIRAARAAKIPVLVDPKTADFTKYSGATIVCPNLIELSLATGVPAHHTEEILAAGQKLLGKFDVQFLVATMSEKGISVLRADGIYHSPARAREVYDVSGAGDTVIATLAASMAGGLKIESAVELANLAAGIVVGKMGTVPIAQHELISALTPSAGITTGEKILDFDRVQRRVAEWRASGETVVFTNGCFDLLHVGHITLLEDCRRYGSKLVLGLNSDASVCRLKGPTRPIVGEQERARVMAALAVVDAVVLFDEDTPIELIRALKPDVLVKGGDYSVETVVGHEDVIANGGRVQIVPTVEGFSTTNIVRKLTGQDN